MLQAPRDSMVGYYIVIAMSASNKSTIRVPSDMTSYEYRFYQDNIVYKFAVQAVNDGGKGPISNFRAVYYCSTGK